MSPFWQGFRSGMLSIYCGWASWACFGAGHVGYLLCERWGRDNADEPDRLFHAAFLLYQRGMEWSYRIQNWIEGGIYCRWLPWGPSSRHSESKDV